MIRKFYLCVLLSSLMLISGCTDIKDINRLNFGNALGFDYKDGKYYGYLQMVDFVQVAKSEGGAKGPPNFSVSKGVGYSPNDAIVNLLNSAQNELFFGHINAIVLSESAIKKGFYNIYDSLQRHHDFTLSPWIFGTNDPLDKIFSQTGFFNQPLETKLHWPLGSFNQISILPPKQLYHFTREGYEPYFTTYLPCLSVNEKFWKKNQKKEPKLLYTGAFFMQNQHYKGFYNLKQLEGLRWVKKDIKRVNILVPNKVNPDMSVVVAPKVKFKNNKTSLNIMIRGDGYIIERDTNNTRHLSDVEKSVNTYIKNEVEALYKLGMEKQTDFLNLEHTLYRKDFKKWKKLYKNGDAAAKPEILNKIIVKINIKHTDSNKNQKLDINKIQ